MGKTDETAIWSRRAILLALSTMLAGCAGGPLQIGSRSLNLPWGNTPTGGGSQPNVLANPMMPTVGSERFGRGPVQVSLLLPLSGEPQLAELGRAMANAAKLAISFVEASPAIGENISVTLRDTGSTVTGATAAAQVAVREGAKLILGPLMAEQVSAIAPLAQAGGVPIIAFANNGAVAGPGVYVLNVLPDAEMKRAAEFIRAQGRRAPAGIFPATGYGDALAMAFRQQAGAAGFAPSAVYSFSDVSEVASVVVQAKALMADGRIDALFIPDRATAAQFAAGIRQAGVSAEDVLFVGSSDWSNDPGLLANPALSGAIFPAIDDAGLHAIAADYTRQFGGRPPQMATIAYTGTILANVQALSMANPPYAAALLTTAAGFTGRDGHFRFLSNGRSEYALTIKQIGNGGATVIDGAKI